MSQRNGAVLRTSGLIALLLAWWTTAGAEEPGLTFFGWSDQHVKTDGDGKHLEAAIDAMNALPGKTFPKTIGGKVATPAFVLGCGDITEWPTTAAKNTYERLITKRLKFPAYDIAGNHDDGGKVPSPTILNWIKSRHGALTYHFKQGGVHFVAVHSQFDPDGPPYQPISKRALEKLRQHLARIPRGEPVVVATHLCFDAMTNRDEFIGALGKANVVLVLGGHYHKATVHVYKGRNFVQLPSPEPRSPGQVTVIRMTRDRVVAVPYDYQRGEWVKEKKKILDAKIRGPTTSAKSSPGATSTGRARRATRPAAPHFGGFSGPREARRVFSSSGAARNFFTTRSSTLRATFLRRTDEPLSLSLAMVSRSLRGEGS